MKNYSGQVSIAGKSPLAVFTHRYQDLKNFLDRNGIDLALYCQIKNILKNLRSPRFIMDGYAPVDLDLCNFSCKFLALCDEPYNVSIHLIDLFPYGLNGHRKYMIEIFNKHNLCFPNTKADII